MVHSCRLIGLGKNSLADVWILVSAAGQDNDSRSCIYKKIKRFCTMSAEWNFENETKTEN